MGRMAFTATNRAADIENFPKLKLEAKESARIVVVHEPEAAYVHNLRAPKIINGAVQYKGEEMDFDFVGNPICLGDENIVKERGLDVKNCPACKAYADFGADQFSLPKKRYATHVFQYQTNGGTKAPANGEGTVKVWAFADQKFGELIDIYETANEESNTPVGPTDVDLLLGPCENAMYQKFKIIPSQKVAHKSSPEASQRFEQAVAANQSKDLYRYIGRKMGKGFMTDKVDEVRRKWAQAKGQQNESNSDGLPERDLTAGLDSLLNEDPWADAASKSEKVKEEKKINKSSEEAETYDDILAMLDD